VRLVSAGSDQVWSDFTATDAIGVRREIGAAAEWLAERAGRGDGPRGEIELLCVDVEGAACAWVTSPSADALVVGAALAGDREEWARGTERSESSVQALATAAPAPARVSLLPGRSGKGRAADEGSETGSKKLAVLMVPDVPARLLVDGLDERGVSVAQVASWWQAVAQAWDPSGPVASGDAVRGEQVVASSAPVSAVVLIDPAGRLVWSWSRDGELVAGGTLRLARGEAEGAQAVRIGAAEVSRLATDWLAWSVQLGEAPRRILCLGPEAGEGGDGLDPSSLGAALTRAWPGATVDLVVHEDPVGATMARLARAEMGGGRRSEGRTTLMDLTTRPGRAHRAMYRWAAAAVLAMSAALIGVGSRAWSAGTKASADAARAEAAVNETVQKVAAPRDDLERASAQAAPRLFLEQKIAGKRLALNPSGGLDPAKPIVAELETLSYVLGGTPGVEIDEIQLLPTNAIAYILVPDTGTYEGVLQSLSGIAGSHVQWTGQYGSEVGGKKRYMLQGKWVGPAKPGGAP
jgi:hypothetical protein